MKINMNGNDNDTNYRYTMDEISLTVCGKGNGCYTIFNNIDTVCRSITHPVDVIMGHIATITGTNYNPLRKSLTGIHTIDIITKIILDYIKHLVICPKCNIPETVPTLQGTKKNITLILICSSCNHQSPVNKYNKTIDIIISYLKAGRTWTTPKGTMVVQPESQSSNLLENLNGPNPFDLI